MAILATPERLALPPLPTFRVLLRATWKRCTERWKVLVGLSLLAPFLGSIGMAIIDATSRPFLEETFSEPTGNDVVIWIVLSVYMILVGVMSVAVFAGKICAAGNAAPVSFRAAFRWGFERWFAMVGVSLVSLLVALPFVVLVSATVIVGALSTSALAVFLVVFTYIGTRLFSVHMLVALRETTVLGAFKEGWRLTRGRFWKIFWRFLALYLVLIGAAVSILLIPLEVLSTVFTADGSLFAEILSALLAAGVQALLGVFGLVYAVILLRSLQETSNAPGTFSAATIP